ncbi:MAG: SCO family protein [Melioribacteraceae bacterium]|nr:SCO family protein [Melioribacteraceae bacterium]MCF8354452.1 SCO family protein [Melioribacteraceae bacterium]MCF8394062.1 SCO family protein [Melioribacteraceae bacterium]MCF8419828.1 SCO family protein [Melioribacteraceae bacterium]
MKKILLLTGLSLFVWGCNNLEVIEDLSDDQYKFINQDSSAVNFPEKYKGKIVVMGFIFTNCPDICPLTTNNMRLIQERVKEEGIENVQFVSLSFDPDFDTPAILKKYAELRSLDLSNWEFLTGDIDDIHSLLKTVQVFAVKGDSSVTPKGNVIQYYIHTDRIALIDQESVIRKNHFGSKANIEEIVDGIKSLD